MQIFATLYFTDIESESSHYKLLKRLGYYPEIYFESGFERLSAGEHKSLAKKIEDELGGCSVHLPYRDILPTAGDPAALARMERAAEIATIYKPRHLVGHPCFRPRTDSILSPSKHIKMGRNELTAPISTPNESFLKNSVSFWKKVIDATECMLFLENTLERTPYPLQLLIKELPLERCSMCLDIGHWHFAGMGNSFHNLPEWFELSYKRLGHLHLHDNDGSSDQHLSIGKGRIDFRLLKSLLGQYGLNPSATIENQTASELEESARYLGDIKFSEN